MCVPRVRFPPSASFPLVGFSPFYLSCLARALRRPTTLVRHCARGVRDEGGIAASQFPCAPRPLIISPLSSSSSSCDLPRSECLQGFSTTWFATQAGGPPWVCTGVYMTTRGPHCAHLRAAGLAARCVDSAQGGMAATNGSVGSNAMAAAAERLVDTVQGGP